MLSSARHLWRLVCRKSSSSAHQHPSGGRLAPEASATGGAKAPELLFTDHRYLLMRGIGAVCFANVASALLMIEASSSVTARRTKAAQQSGLTPTDTTSSSSSDSSSSAPSSSDDTPSQITRVVASWKTAATERIVALLHTDHKIALSLSLFMSVGLLVAARTVLRRYVSQVELSADRKQLAIWGYTLTGRRVHRITTPVKRLTTISNPAVRAAISMLARGRGRGRVLARGSGLTTWRASTGEVHFVPHRGRVVVQRARYTRPHQQQEHVTAGARRSHAIVLVLTLLLLLLTCNEYNIPSDLLVYCVGWLSITAFDAIEYARSLFVCLSVCLSVYHAHKTDISLSPRRYTQLRSDPHAHVVAERLAIRHHHVAPYTHTT